MNLADFERRAKELLTHADAVLATKKVDGYANQWVDTEAFAQLRASGLSFLRNAFGTEHPYFQEFTDRVKQADPSDTRTAKGILEAARSEVAGGWALTTTGIVSAGIFADFLEMAAHLLENGYKDAAAVMAGSVLEEHVRQLSRKHGIAIEQLSSGKMVPRKADSLNADLAKLPAYNLLEQKSVIAWLDLRNKAAHGDYNQYNKDQVALMHQGVSDFIARNAL
jgi:hypothetical protein